ncbi:Reverse transcriptase zinc-binding domain, partial [Thalictrum thalictroides]
MLQKLFHIIAFVVGKGNRVSFWNDIWCGESSFRDEFPELYLKSYEKEGSVASHLKWEDNVHAWDLKIRARLSEAEIEQTGNLLHLLESVQPCVEDEDTIRWTLSRTGRYTVRSMHDVIAAREGVVNYPHKLVWKSDMPYK